MWLTAQIIEDRGVSVLFTEHDMDVVFGSAHRIMLLTWGRLIAEGSAEDIRNNALFKDIYLGVGNVFGMEEGAVHAWSKGNK